MRRIPKIKFHAKPLACVITKHRPAIFTALGFGFGCMAYIGGIRATPKALELIEEEKTRINNELMYEARKTNSNVCRQIEDLTSFEKIKTCWKVYAPSFIMMLGSAAFIASGYHGISSRHAALAAAYEISQDALRRYRDTARDIIGPDDARRIDEGVAESRIASNPVNHNDIYDTGCGNTLCYDPMSGRYFTSSPEIIRRAESYINRNICDDMFCSLNEFYIELGLPEVKMGEHLGWEVGRKSLAVSMASKLTENDEPCLVLDYETVTQ